MLQVHVANGSKDHLDSVNKVTTLLSHQNCVVFKQFWYTYHSKSIMKNSLRGDCPLSHGPVTAYLLCSSLDHTQMHRWNRIQLYVNRN